MKQGKKPWIKFKALKWALAALGFILSFYLSFNYYQGQTLKFKTSTDLKAERAVAKFESHLQVYETLITQTEAFFITIQDINFSNFHSYYTNLKDISRFHGIQGLGFSKHVEKKDIQEFLKNVRKEIPHYHIWPWEDKDDYFPVLYLAPFSGAIGYDQSTEPKREDAFRRAIQKQDTTMSGKINFMLEKDLSISKPGFLFIRPVYFDANKKNLSGIIFAPFLYHNFFSNLWVDFSDDFYFSVYGGHDLNEESLIYRTYGSSNSQDAGIFKKIKLYGENFNIIFHPKEINHNIIQISLMVLLLGLSFTILVIKVLNDTIKRAEQSSLNETYLEESLRARDEFISLASHELKTPLTSLKLRAQFSARKLKYGNVGPKDIKEFSSEIVKQVDRLERLVNDILDFSRIRTGNLSLQPQRFNLEQLIKELLNRMSPQFTSQNYPTVTYPKKDIYVNWDKLRIEQVMNNLLANAIKYGKNSPIHIDILQINREITISVKDQGIGIDPKFRETIFNRFERAGISPNEISGLGLGLYITYQIVTSHQGRIWVESELGKGSTFYIKIPKNPRF